MTEDEHQADLLLMAAKKRVKESFQIIDPAPLDPLAATLLRILDDIDAAHKRLTDRFGI